MNFPKVQLHYHLDGAIPYRLYCKYAREQGIIDDSVTDEKWVNDFIMSESTPFYEALKRFGLLTDLLQDYDHLVETTYEELKDEYEAGTRLIEIRFAPQLHTNKEMDMDKAVEAVLEGRNKFLTEYPNMVCGILLCMMNNGPEVDNMAENLYTVKLAAKYKEQGVVGIDLAGAEGMNPMSDYDEAFALARELGVNYTIHAGEGGESANMQYAINQNTTRIGHGVRYFDNPSVLDELISHDVTLEVSVTSNILSRAIASYETHPIRELMDKGVKLNICTDDPTLMGITINSEYEKIAKIYGFTEKEFILTNLYGAKASFCPNKESVIEELENALKNA